MPYPVYLSDVSFDECNEINRLDFYSPDGWRVLLAIFISHAMDNAIACETTEAFARTILVSDSGHIVHNDTWNIVWGMIQGRKYYSITKVKE